MFQAALAAKKALDLDTHASRIGHHEVIHLSGLLATALDRTMNEVMRDVRSTKRAVHDDTSIGGFNRGKLIGVKAMAFRLIVDGIPAAMAQLPPLYEFYRAAAESHNRQKNFVRACHILAQGTLLGVALGIPDALDIATERLVFFSAQSGITSAINAMDEAIALIQANRHEDAQWVMRIEAKATLRYVSLPMDLFIFHQTLDDLADSIWQSLGTDTQGQKQSPEVTADYFHRQMALARQQYFLWHRTLTAVMPLSAQGSPGLEKSIETGLEKLQRWANKYHGMVAADRIRVMTQEEYQPEVPTLSPELTRAVAAMDWSSIEAVNHLTTVLAKVYGVTPREIERAFLPDMTETPLAERLRADLHPHTFGRAASAVMQIEFMDRRDRWESRR